MNCNCNSQSGSAHSPHSRDCAVYQPATDLQPIAVNKVAFVLHRDRKHFIIRKDTMFGLAAATVNLDGFFTFKPGIEFSAMAIGQMLEFVKSQGKSS